MQNCYNSGMEDVDVRLTNRHIKTLTFLQEIGKENKELKQRVTELEGQLLQCKDIHKHAEESKAKIREIQEQLLQRNDEINKLLIEKHEFELMQKVEEGIKAEKQWAEEKRELKAEIEKLQNNISGLQSQLQSSQEKDEKITNLQIHLDSTNQELSKSKQDKEKLEEWHHNQLREIQRLKNVEERNKDLVDEIQGLVQKNKELHFKIGKLEKEVGEVGYREQEEILSKLKNKLTVLHKEKQIFTEREKENEQTIADLKSENEKLRIALRDSEKMRSDLQKQYEELLQQIRDMNKKMKMSSSEKEKQTFKEFVVLKREMAQVKQENEELRSRLKSKGSLPIIKDATDVRVGSARSGRDSRKSSLNLEYFGKK